MSPMGLVYALEQRGIELEIAGKDLRIAPLGCLSDDELIIIKKFKHEIISFLEKTKTPQLSATGIVCKYCSALRLCYKLDDGSDACPACAEWRCIPVHAFTLPEALGIQDGQRYGCCLACGGAWELHGHPLPSSWKRIDNSEVIGHIQIRYVLASASNILRSTS